MSYFLYHRRTAITGRLLAASLFLPAGDRPDHIILPNEYLIRWGSQVEAYGVDSALPDRVLNTRAAIRYASDKLLALQMMQAAGVPVPPFTSVWDEAKDELNFPVLGRMRDHTRGRDIITISEPTSAGYRYAAHTTRRTGHDFFVELIPKVREFRIHVFMGEPILCQRKVVADERRASRNPVAWNHRGGYRYVNMRSSLPSLSRRESAVAAVHALGLDFGAVDIIVGPDDSEYVLEVNTGPGLASRSAYEYATRFAQVLGIERVNESILSSLGEDE